jgi:hypothetical protein
MKQDRNISVPGCLSRILDLAKTIDAIQCNDNHPLDARNLSHKETIL